MENEERKLTPKHCWYFPRAETVKAVTATMMSSRDSVYCINSLSYRAILFYLTFTNIRAHSLYQQCGAQRNYSDM